MPETTPDFPVESRPSQAFLGKDFGMIMKDDNGYMKSAMLIGDPGLGAFQESHNINVGVLGGFSTFKYNQLKVIQTRSIAVAIGRVQQLKVKE